MEDVEFLSRAIQTVLKREGLSIIDSLLCSFPLRILGNSAKKRGPYYGPSSLHSDLQTNLLGFTTTLSSSDEEQEAGARFPKSQLPQRRAEEEKAAAAYTAAAARPIDEATSQRFSPAAAPETTVAERRVQEDVLEIGVSAKEKSAIMGEPVMEEEEKVEEIVHASLPPFDYAKLETRPGTSGPIPPDDNYESMDVVEDIPNFEKNIKRARPMAPAVELVRVDFEVRTGPSPVLKALVTNLSESHYASSSLLPQSTPTESHPLSPARPSSPPPKRRRLDAITTAKEIQLRPFSTQQQQQLDMLKRLLGKNINATGKRILAEIDKDVRPEMLGEIFSIIHACKKNMESIKEVTDFWEPQFSREEKERFLKNVGKMVSTFGMVTWMDLMRYD